MESEENVRKEEKEIRIKTNITLKKRIKTEVQEKRTER